jgi:hypothetical protein
MFDLDEEDLKRAVHAMNKAARRIEERMIKDAMFGERPPHIPFTSTGTMRPSMPFREFAPLWTVVTSLFAVEKKKRCREVKLAFWQRLWVSLTNLNPWPYSPIEYYEVDVPAVMIDRANNQIICHPSLEREIRKAVDEANYDTVKR